MIVLSLKFRKDMMLCKIVGPNYENVAVVETKGLTPRFFNERFLISWFFHFKAFGIEK